MESSTNQDACVLLVEDERDLRNLYTKWLEPQNTVIPVKNGREAISVIVDDETNIDVVLLDRDLPDLSPETIIRECRTHQPNSRIGIVSAVRPETDILDLNIDSYLHKPASEEKLLNLVTLLVGRSKYDERLSDYYAKADKIATLKQYNSEEHLESNEQYKQLVDELQIINQEMEQIVDFTNNEEVEGILRDTLKRLDMDGETGGV